MPELYASEDRKKAKPFDRYRNCKILTDLETGEVLLETRDINEIPTSIYDSYHTVKSNEACRLDIISYNYYGNPLLWWVLAQANNIYDPLVEPTAGKVIRIPNISKLYDKNGVLL